MRILLTNDDGYDQPGILELESALSPHHDVWVVAPKNHCSGTSQALGLYSSMELWKKQPGKWVLEGTPTDCVKIALMEIMKDKPPDILISGVNPGANLGHNILYSGTVAAATEAALWGIPAIAISVDVISSGSPPHFRTAVSVLRTLIETGVKKQLPPGILLNVNVPALDIPEIKGWKWTRMARYSADISFRQLEPGRVFSYDRYRRLPVIDPEGSDADAIENGLVSLTLLTTDRTSDMQPLDMDLPGGSI